MLQMLGLQDPPRVSHFFLFFPDSFAVVAGRGFADIMLLQQTGSSVCSGAVEIEALAKSSYAHKAILLENKFLYVLGGKFSTSTDSGK